MQALPCILPRPIQRFGWDSPYGFMKKRMILAVLVAMMLSTPASAFASGVREKVVYEEGMTNNISIKTSYDDSLEMTNSDLYRVVVHLEERDQTTYFDVNMVNGTTNAYMEAGTYRVQSITYLGFNDDLKTVPAACSLRNRLYEGEVTDFNFAIGEESINKLFEIEEIGNVFEENDVLRTGYDFFGIAAEMEDVENDGQGGSSPFVDEDVFPDTEEGRQQLQEYHDYLREEGYMDAYGNYTEKALEEMDALGINSSIEDSEEEDNAETEGENLEGTDDGGQEPAEETEEEEYDGVSDNINATDSSDVKATRYDDAEDAAVEEGDHEEEGPGILGIITKALPYVAFLAIGMLIYGVMNKFIGKK